VRDHFAYLSERVARHHGFIVKTVGDAVMAAFHDPVDAVRAVLSMQVEVASFNRGRSVPAMKSRSAALPRLHRPAGLDQAVRSARRHLCAEAVRGKVAAGQGILCLASARVSSQAIPRPRPIMRTGSFKPRSVALSAVTSRPASASRASGSASTASEMIASPPWH
jgi:hypothetical protein